MTPLSVAQRYVDALNHASIDDLEALLSPSVEIRTPAISTDGFDDAASYYQDVVFLGQAILQLIAEFPTPNGVAARVDVRSSLAPDLPALATVMLFDVDDNGVVTRLESFHRVPPEVEPVEVRVTNLADFSDFRALAGIDDDNVAERRPN